MKKLIMVLLLVLATVGSAMAAGKGVGSMDKECQARGYDYGVAKWEYTNGGYELESERPGYNTSVTGDSATAQWTSDKRVQGIVTKEGQFFYIHNGGLSGTIEKDQKFGISHVTLCGRSGGSNGGNGGPHGVPEFSTMTLGLAVVIAGLGIGMLRRN